MDIHGVPKVCHADFPNLRLNTVAESEVVRFIETCIKDWGAEAIVTHHYADVNVDHRVTSTAAMEASRLFQRIEGVPTLRLLLMCEVSGATEWSLDSSENRFTPNYSVEIGREALDVKWKHFLHMKAFLDSTLIHTAKRHLRA